MKPELTAHPNGYQTFPVPVGTLPGAASCWFAAAVRTGLFCPAEWVMDGIYEGYGFKLPFPALEYNPNGRFRGY
ncbi:MAG: hypothetical protein H6556_19470 [Lewinellaceae bacterium]|nr:hypothetical protein [Lewinellaceae bacterium]